MKSSCLDEIVRAVLYEGYILYPGRPGPQKNARERFTFGRVYPESYSLIQEDAEPCVMQSECLFKSTAQPTLNIRVQFLQPAWREIGALTPPLKKMPGCREPALRIVPSISIAGELYQTSQEAIERKIHLDPIAVAHDNVQTQQNFQFPAARSLEPIYDEYRLVRAVVLHRHEPLRGTVTVDVRRLDARHGKVTVRVMNQSDVPAEAIFDKDSIALRTFASAHVILNLQGAEFISLTEPDVASQPLADQCENVGVWPVLVGNGNTHARDTMLASPIILYDYPQVADGNVEGFFNNTENDDLQALRIRTMVDGKLREMASVGPFARQMERAEHFPVF